MYSNFSRIPNLWKSISPFLCFVHWLRLVTPTNQETILYSMFDCSIVKLYPLFQDFIYFCDNTVAFSNQNIMAYIWIFKLLFSKLLILFIFILYTILCGVLLSVEQLSRKITMGRIYKPSATYFRCLFLILSRVCSCVVVSPQK